jgi:hypothetical protein
MAGKKSNATQMMERILDRYHEFKNAHRDDDEVPFMQEKISRRSASARINEMTPIQRRALVDRVGIDEAIRMARKG